MSTTVTTGGWEVTSNHEQADDMVAALTPPKDDKGEAEAPRVTVKDGQPVKEEEAEEAKLKEAAAELGKKGGKAAAEKRAQEKTSEKPEPPKEAKADEEKAEEKPEERPDEKPEGNPRHDPKARIAQLARERREAEAAAAQERRQREQLEARLAELERRVTPPERGPEAKPAPKPADRPRAEDFENYEEYLDARDAYNRQQWEGEQQQKQRQAAIQHQVVEFGKRVDTAIRTYNGHLAKAAEADPDFAERVAVVTDALPTPSPLLEDPRQLTAGNVLADQIVLSAEKAPALLLYFAEHPDDLQRILALRTPEEVKIEVRVIARGLDAVTAGASSKPSVSKAPSPVRPVTGTPPTAESDITGDLEFDEFVRRNRAKGK